MQGDVLIIDGIAVNRISLQVRLEAAWYGVRQAADLSDALRQIRERAPDLILLGSNLPDADIARALPRLRARSGGDVIPILVLSDDPQARAALLAAGADDVLTTDAIDTMMPARVRSLLRAQAAASEWRLRDGTTRALGLAEAATPFEGPMRLVLLHAPEIDTAQWSRRFAEAGGGDIRAIAMHGALRELPRLGPDTVLILALGDQTGENGLTLLADLRARGGTRHSAVLVMVPEGRGDLAARALDLGADDVMTANHSARELQLRARRLRAARAIADQLRATVRNGAEAAIYDPLTGLYNRRYAMPHLDRVAQQARQSGKSFAVMMADLDHFKRINDWYGHAAGDAVLVECARRLKENLRSVDLIARIGGEEFMIVMPGAGREAARQAALRLCKRISDTPFAVPGQDTPVSATISIGIALGPVPEQADGAAWPGSSDRPTGSAQSRAVLQRADKALYQAKQAGRNRYADERPAA